MALGASFAILSLIAGPLSVLLVTAALRPYRLGVEHMTRLAGTIDNDPNGQ